MSTPDGDQVLLDRVARRLGLQAAGLVAVSLLVVLGTLLAVLVHQDALARDRDLLAAVHDVEDVDDPPADAWAVIDDGTATRRTAGLPPALEPTLNRLRASASASPVLTTLDVDGASYRVATRRIDGRVSQVVLDLAPARADRERLLLAGGVAALLGLLVSALVGALLGRRAVAPLTQALGLQRRFVADASHELRTPLTLLSTRAQVLERALREGRSDDRAVVQAAGVVRDAARLADLVEDLLTAADPRQDRAREPVDVTALLEDVADSAREHATEREVQVVVDAGPVHVSGAPVALRRAVLALLDNAVDHSPPGGTVTLSGHARSGQVVLAVSDEGPGVAPEDAAEVFARFRSGGQRAGRPRYGLGLALAQDVAARHGGRLVLAQQPGQGARFELLLPPA